MPKKNKGGRAAKLGKMNTKKREQTIKKAKNGSAMKKSASSDNPHRPDPSGGKKGSQFRTRSTIKRLKMYTSKPNQAQMKKLPTDPQAGKIQPDRRWFGNVRSVDQKELDKYRKSLEENQKHTGSGFSVLVQGKKMPLSLVKDQFDKSLSQGERLLQIESFQDTFGPKSKRKRPNLQIPSLEQMVLNVEDKLDQYEEGKDQDLHKHEIVEDKEAAREQIFEKGKSKRIWDELYKVIDSSDVLLYVLDARNPNGTRTKFLENYVKKNCPHKHMVFVLNKCDLVPTAVTQKWVRYLQQTYPTIAFQASIQNPFGKGTLIQLLKQFDNLHKDRKNISVGMIGYPNVGKSSVINALKKKTVCKVAPIPGETKVWQYITMTKRIYLIDCPGIVYDQGESKADKVLKGVVRPEKIPDPELYIDPILQKTQKKHINDVYGINEWEDGEDFVNQLAAKTGKLLKGGEPDINNVCKSVIMDWQRGNIPYFEYPPQEDLKMKKEDEEQSQEEEEAVEEEDEDH